MIHETISHDTRSTTFTIGEGSMVLTLRVNLSDYHTEEQRLAILQEVREAAGAISSIVEES